MDKESKQMDRVSSKYFFGSKDLDDTNTYLDFINAFLDDFSTGKDVFCK